MRAGSCSALALAGPSAGRAADRTSRTVPSGTCNCSGGKPSGAGDGERRGLLQMRPWEGLSEEVTGQRCEHREPGRPLSPAQGTAVQRP